LAIRGIDFANRGPWEGARRRHAFRENEGNIGVIASKITKRLNSIM
jgi:hypothetical protein